MSIDTIKDLGAVFTPNEIVNKMLDMLPKNVFEEKSDLKWLEPSVGDGNFVVEILKRKRNVNITCIEIYKPYCNAFSKKTKLNVLNMDFLEFNPTHKFDIIIGNPPYQKPNKKNKKSRGGKSQLYMIFLQKCIELLNPDGYLLFIHPSNWRKIDSPCLKYILENTTIHNIVLHQKKYFQIYL
jgi:adenine-specific DNA-methyltransferase